MKLTCNQLITLLEIFRGMEMRAICGTTSSDLKFLTELGLVIRCYVRGGKYFPDLAGDVWSTTLKGDERVKQALGL